MDWFSRALHSETGVLIAVGPGSALTTPAVDGPATSIFFLLVLFALGIRLGPQFVAGLRGTVVPQSLLAVALAVVGSGVVLAVAAVTRATPRS